MVLRPKKSWATLRLRTIRHAMADVITLVVLFALIVGFEVRTPLSQ